MRPFALIAASITLCACGTCGSGGLSAAEKLSIGRWGTSLLVTAPASIAVDRGMAAKLNQKVTVDFKDAPIADVADFLRQLSGANIVVAPGVIAGGGTVTMKANDMTLGNVLTWVKTLTGVHLGYVHGALFISDKPVEEASVTRMYDISDLTLPMKDFPGPELALNAPSGMGGGGATLFQPPKDSTSNAPTTDEIVDIITKVVRPGEWDK